MARKDARTLRDDASEAAAAGKHKRALECYLELERLEAGDPQWSKRAGDMYRRINKDRDAVAAYDRAVDRYATGGFIVQAIALCKVILQIDPTHSETVRRLADMTSQQESGRSRIGALAARQAQVSDEELATLPTRGGRPAAVALEPERTPVRAADPGDFELELEPVRAVAASRPASAAPRDAGIGDFDLSLAPDLGDMEIERASTARARRDSALELDADDLEDVEAAPRRPAPVAAPVVTRPAAPPAPSVKPPPPKPAPPTPGRARTKAPSNGPITLLPGAPLDSVRLGDIARGALERRKDDGSGSGMFVIPLDDTDLVADIEDDLDDDQDDTSSLDLVITTDVPTGPDPEPEADNTYSAEPEELSLDELSEYDDDDELAQPRAWSAGARRALAETPLLSGLSHDALEALVTRLALVTLAPGEILFREGDAGQTLYIVASGQVAVIHEGPPQVVAAHLGAGAFFGEVALITEQPRGATIAAVDDVELLAIDRDLVSQLIADHPEVLFVILRFVRDRLVERLLDTSPLFSPLPPDDRASLAARFKFLEIEPGSVIVEEGARAGGLYVFLAGRADLRRGKELLGYLGAGDLAGEASLLRGAPSPVRCGAVTRCLALCLSGADFREIIMTHPHVLEYVNDLADARSRAIADLSGLGGRVDMV
ncbi:MAG: cyclic nucleotide-binding domain-containing protein [Deltaproteobacteria bacterium]|nr:cyclic nucleotide-binding domain-containing protein [Deltaproteobacteria bacterium]